MHTTSSSIVYAAAWLLCVAVALPQPAGNPLAQPGAIVTVGQVRFTMLTSSVVRIELRQRDQQFQNGQTLVVLNRWLPVPPFRTLTTNNITIIETKSFLLRYNHNAPFDDALSVKLFRPRYWSNVTTWTPRSSLSNGNLGGTFHTLDGLRGWYSLNCTQDNLEWDKVGFGSEPLAHCSFGLVSKVCAATNNNIFLVIFELIVCLYSLVTH
jgi:hypothetical protein